MYILGINGGVRMGYQDISAVLVKDGKAQLIRKRDEFDDLLKNQIEVL